MSNINNNTPLLCVVDRDYLKYVHKIDNRISVKYNNRPFVGLTILINSFHYVVPLTSQTTEERMKNGKKKRSRLITTFVKDKDMEIANLLHNNMFPAPEELCTPLVIDMETDTYEAMEQRYIRKHIDEINQKSLNVYNERYNKRSRNWSFLNKSCCDYKLLEQAYLNYKSN